MGTPAISLAPAMQPDATDPSKGKITLIGFCGYARSGKDTAAEILCRRNHSYMRVAFADRLRKLAMELDAPLGEGVHYNDLPTTDPDRQALCQRLTSLTLAILREIDVNDCPSFMWADELAKTLNLVVRPTGEHVTFGEAVREFGYEGAKARYPKYIRPHLVALGDCLRTCVYHAIWLESCIPRTLEAFQKKYAGVTGVVVTDVRYENEGNAIRRLGGWVWYMDRPGVLAANPTEGHSIPFVNVHTVVNNSGDILALTTEMMMAFNKYIHGGHADHSQVVPVGSCK